MADIYSTSLHPVWQMKIKLTGNSLANYFFIAGTQWLHATGEQLKDTQLMSECNNGKMTGLSMLERICTVATIEIAIQNIDIMKTTKNRVIILTSTTALWFSFCLLPVGTGRLST